MVLTMFTRNGGAAPVPSFADDLSTWVPAVVCLPPDVISYTQLVSNEIPTIPTQHCRRFRDTHARFAVIYCWDQL